MDALRLVALLIYTFGAFAYGAILVLWVRELAQPNPAARQPAKVRSEVDLVNGVLVAVSLIWFVVNICSLLFALGTGVRIWQVEAVTLLVAFLYPPLIMHAEWAESTGDPATGRSRVWRWMLWPAYVVALAIPVWCMTTLLNPDASSSIRQVAERLLGAGLSLLFVGAAVYSVVLSRPRRSLPVPRPGAHRSMMSLYGLMAVLFIAIFVISVAGLGDVVGRIGITLIEIAARSLPLVFLFVGAYYESRFEFFDLFVKRGLSLVVTVAVLTIWFAALLPALRPLAATWAAPWVFAIILVPVVAAMPWLYRALNDLLDRRWLGRRFSTIEAVTRFLAGLRSATSEGALVKKAEEGLTEIFSAPAAVRLDTDSAVSFDAQVEETTDKGPYPIRVVMGPRASDAPYFSEDVVLLRTLAEVFASALENVHLQQRKLEHEQRTRELSLQASRSELKALRAQINPHFLFNALNAIAGLIHRDPAAADRTIEQLADVFRYALQGAEREWATLDEEIDFARAYLEVERARFGDRLTARFDVAPGAGRLRVPVMMVQTLVENAVKHGASMVRGPASVEVTARIRRETLVVSVSDNGPGFGGDPSTGSEQRSGHGLVNVRERLAGYFGEAAQLALDRDAKRALTIVSMELPVVTAEPPQVAGAIR